MKEIFGGLGVLTIGLLSFVILFFGLIIMALIMDSLDSYSPESREKLDALARKTILVIAVMSLLGTGMCVLGGVA